MKGELKPIVREIDTEHVYPVDIMPVLENLVHIAGISQRLTLVVILMHLTLSRRCQLLVKSACQLVSAFGVMTLVVGT